MFRVLSDEESKKVTRWKAPDFGDKNSSTVADTPQFVRTQATQPGDTIKPILGSPELKPGRTTGQSAPPKLQTINSANVLTEYLSFQSGGSVSDVVATSAELLQSSYDEGYSKGYAEGNVALHQHAVKELTSVIAALKAACEHRQDADLEHELVALTLDIARLVIRREISIDDKIMLNIVAAGIDQLPGASNENTSVYLHPLDASTVHRYMPEDSGLRIVDDPLIARGGCRIESGSSIVNAGVEDWLASVSIQLGLTSAPTDSLASDSALNDNTSNDLTDP